MRIEPTTLLKADLQIKVDIFHNNIIICMIPSLNLKVLSEFLVLEVFDNDITTLKSEFEKNLNQLVKKLAEGPFLEEVLEKLKKT